MDKSKINPGVKCQVDECIHYEKGDLCSASKIEVATKHGTGCEFADCLTFEPGGDNCK